MLRKKGIVLSVHVRKLIINYSSKSYKENSKLIKKVEGAIKTEISDIENSHIIKKMYATKSWLSED